MSNVKEKLDTKRLLTVASDRIKKAFRDLARMVRDVEIGNTPLTSEQEDVLENFSQEMIRGMVLSDVYGRMRTMQELAVKEGEAAAVVAGVTNIYKLTASSHRRIFADQDTPDNIVEWLDLPFDEAAAHIAEREPMLAKGWVAAAEAYARHGFALARNTSILLAEELRNRIADAIREGQNPEEVAEDAQWLSHDFDKNYMQTVAATNFASAYVAGREQQMRSPGVAKHIGAHIFKSALLPTTRPNHRACHDFIADPDDPLWEYISPLLGYNCYCRKRPIFNTELKAMGLEVDPRTGKLPPARRPAGAEPDSMHFGRRSDKVYYG